MNARRAALVGSKVTRERYGLEHYAKLGRRAAMKRYGIRYRPSQIAIRRQKGSK